MRAKNRSKQIALYARPLALVAPCLLALTLATAFILAGRARAALEAFGGDNGAGEAPTTAPPLPADCSSLANPGEDPPASCIYGYVYHDGVAVAGANVTIHQETAQLSLVTAYGPDSTEPYFAAALSDPPLAAMAGDLVAVEAAYSGQDNTVTFTVFEGAQQVDVSLASTCGPTTIGGGVIDANTTWTQPCSPYLVTGNLLVQSGALLTLEPGTVVKFGDGKAMQVDGYLAANGAANSMVVFTTAVSPLPGAWSYLLITGSGDADLTYGLVEYAGGATVSNNAALRVDAAAPTVMSTTIRYSANNGVFVYNGGSLGMSGSAVVDNERTGIEIDSTGAFLMSYSEVSQNDKGGIFAGGGGDFWVLFSTIADNSGDRSGVHIRGTSTTGNIAGNMITGNVNSNNGGGIKVYQAEVSTSDNIIIGNSARNGGGIHYASVGSPRQVVIDGNYVISNTATQSGGGLYYYGGADTWINLNIFAGNYAAQKCGGLDVGNVGATNFVGVNTIINNRAAGNGGGLCLTDNDARLVNNTIINNSGGTDFAGIYVEKNPVQFDHNNIFDNSDYELFNGNAQGTPDLVVENNWWFAFDASTIRDRTWDYYDDANLGLIDFEPFLLDFDLDAPITPPSGLAAMASTTAITTTWGENAEDDLDGYKLYYSLDGPTMPFSGTGALEGDSPIDVGHVLSARLTGLPPGTYYVTVTAYDTAADGNEDQTEGHESWFAGPQTAVVPGPPHADFSGAPTSGPAPLLVDFTDLSSGTIDSWAWDFGDGGTSQNQHPDYTYLHAGTYTVTLQVSGAKGNDTITRTNYITVYEPVAADFSATPTSGVAPLTVDFSNLSRGNYDSCSWSFGDGGSSSNCDDPSHTYNLSGSYTVTLTVSGPGGSDSETKIEYITVYEPVTADFSATPTSGVAPLSVNFSNLSRGNYNSCSWSFGDGGSSTTCNDPSHTYNLAGSYTVTLTVSGPGGTDTITKAGYITVSDGSGHAIFLPVLLKP